MFRKALVDVNRDGVVTSADLHMIKNSINENPAGLAALSDVNQDGFVNVSDRVLVSNRMDIVISACEAADINDDGRVTSNDVAIVESYLNNTDSSLNMEADLDGDGLIGNSDLVKINNLLLCRWKMVPPPADPYQ